MCGRYYVDDKTAKEIQEVIRNLDNHLEATPKYGDVYPTNNAMIISQENNNSTLCKMIWGFPQYQRKGVIFNARVETVLEKRTFSESIKHRRCLIPARGFYEWDRDKNKIAFERSDNQVMLLSGIWNCYGLDKKFTILTTNANKSMKPVHDRMPLILEPDEVESWLYDGDSVEFLLHKEPKELSIDSGNVQQTFEF